MSTTTMELDTREQLCYVPCTNCSTVLAVSVPLKSLCKVVTIRCGHCNNLISVDMRGLTVAYPSHHFYHHHQHQHHPMPSLSLGQPSSANKSSMTHSYAYQEKVHEASLISNARQEPPRVQPERAPEKKQRISSAYNRFIKEEIQRIKAGNPNMSHREAFSTAAKNWALFPYMQLGLMLDDKKQEA
uniref:YABBY transcription factor n=1 Tax=Ephedra distachya TaxID=3389 RepID=A0A140KQD4_EPHDI|nr:YABBY transcription factor [Ephedra distachya]